VNDLLALLRETVVLIRADNGAMGTGFFVAPGQIMTCGHVVDACGDGLTVLWQGRELPVSVSRIEPAERGEGRYRDLPDTAILDVEEPVTHDCVWLADEMPERGTDLVALGYNDWPAPRSPGDIDVQLSDVPLTLAGQDGKAWRVSHDDLTEGMSGGPVLDQRTGRVVGMTKAVLDTDERRVVGGWIIGMDMIGEALPEVPRLNGPENRDGGAWHQIATHRRRLTEEIFGRSSVGEGVRPPKSARPSWWLSAHNHVVDFVPPAQFETLVSWCLDDGPDPSVVRLVHAPGGVGKTRMSLELAHRLNSRHGWVAGVAGTESATASLVNSLSSLVREGHRVFCAVDYAEANITAVRELIDTLTRLDARQVRILLLARTVGRWWQRIAPGAAAAELIDPDPLALSDIGEDEPEAIAAAAYLSFRRAMGLSEGTAAELSLRGGLRRALDLHAAALVQLLNEQHGTSGVGDPLESLLHHERNYWERAAATQGHIEFGAVSKWSDRILAIPTLLPEADAHTAAAAIARLATPDEPLPWPPGQLASVLAQLYPGDEGRFWSPLIPDRVGEKLVADVLTHDSSSAQEVADLLVRLVGDVDEPAARHVVTVLGRVAGLTDPGTAPLGLRDRAYTVLARLGSAGPAVYSPLVEPVLTGNDPEEAASALTSGAGRRPLSAGRDVTAYRDTATLIGSAYRSWLAAAFPPDDADLADFRQRGLTARGAGHSVVRRLGLETFTVVAVGSVSGDVFANGLLRLPGARLVAAFDQRHIFVDPTPGPAAAEERRRLFADPGSSWDDYDRAVISAGGGVWSRAAATVPVKAAALDVTPSGDGLSPTELIRAILRARVDVLWLAGSGVYVRSADEVKRAPDAVGVSASELRCRVIGEPGAGGITPEARIEYARKGGSVTADFLDGAAGLRFFDREVNAKLLLRSALTQGVIDEATRGAWWDEVRDQLADQALKDVADELCALEDAATERSAMLSIHRRIVVHLERRGHVDRVIDSLPDDAVLADRATTGSGLTDPEIAVLLARTKLSVFGDLLASTFPDEEPSAEILRHYFPERLADGLAALIPDHPLRREIVCCALANAIVDEAGLTFVFQLTEETRASLLDIVHAYLVAQAVFPDFGDLRREVDSLPAERQSAVRLQAQSYLRSVVRLLLQRRPSASTPLRLGVERLSPYMEGQPDTDGLPESLGRRIARLSVARELLEISLNVSDRDVDAEELARIYAVLVERFRMASLLSLIAGLPRNDRWQARTRTMLTNQLYASVAALADGVLSSTSADLSPDDRISEWEQRNAAAIARTGSFLVSPDDSSAELEGLITMVWAIRGLVMATY
jgi:hypothetical protein